MGMQRGIRKQTWRIAMQTHDPMWDLQGLIDQPVSPDPVFTEAVRQQLLAEFSPANDTSDDERLLAHLEQAGLVLGSIEHRPQTRPKIVTMIVELVLVAAIVFGANAAIDSAWWSRSMSSSTPSAPTSPNGQMSPTFGVPYPAAPPTNLVMWKHAPEKNHQIASAGMAAIGTRFYHVITSDSFTGVEALTASTGKKLWRFAVTPSRNSSIVAAGEGTLLVSGTTANDASGNPRWGLYALDPKKGKQRWALDLPAEPGRLAQSNGIAYITYGTSSIMAVNIDSGLMIWQKDIPAPQVIADLAMLSGRLYVTTVSGSILNMSWDGTLRGTIAPPFGYTFGSPAVYDNILVVAGTRTDRTGSLASPSILAAFDIMHDNALIWARGFSGKIGDPVVRDYSLMTTVPEPPAAYNTHNQYAVVRIDPRTGKTIWTYAFHSSGFSAIATTIAPQSMAVVSSAANVLYGFDSKSGMHLWAMGKMPIAQTIASDDGMVFGLLDDGSLIAIRPAPGSGIPVQQTHGPQ
jgi:outer membrane protein assembly factor BamB